MQPLYDKPKSKPQPVETRRHTEELVLAPFGRRLIAFIIDGIILSIIGGLLFFGGREPGFIASFAIGAAYQWYFLTAERGQTIGKRVMNLRVIKTDGTRITDREAVIRYVGYWVSGICLLLGFLWAAFDGYNQAWHDKFAHTYVVMAE